jgi:hypothetical protein
MFGFEPCGTRDWIVTSVGFAPNNCIFPAVLRDQPSFCGGKKVCVASAALLYCKRDRRINVSTPDDWCQWHANLLLGGWKIVIGAARNTGHNKIVWEFLTYYLIVLVAYQAIISISASVMRSTQSLTDYIHWRWSQIAKSARWQFSFLVFGNNWAFLSPETAQFAKNFPVYDHNVKITLSALRSAVRKAWNFLSVSSVLERK